MRNSDGKISTCAKVTFPANVNLRVKVYSSKSVPLFQNVLSCILDSFPKTSKNFIMFVTTNFSMKKLLALFYRHT